MLLLRWNEMVILHLLLTKPYRSPGVVTRRVDRGADLDAYRNRVRRGRNPGSGTCFVQYRSRHETTQSRFGVSGDQPQGVDIRGKSRLHKFDCFDDDDWGAALRDPGSNFGDDRRMGDAVQISKRLRVGEDHLRQCGAVDLTV